MGKFASAALAGVLFLVVASTVHAGGYEYGTDNGAEALARAGASTAYSNGMSQYTNIAGIADTPRYLIYLTNNMIWRDVLFQRLAEPEISSAFGTIPEHRYEDVENLAGPYLTGVGFAANIRLTDYLVLNLGFNGPASVGRAEYSGPNYTNDQSRDGDGNWEHDLSGPARFDQTYMDILVAFPSIGLGLTVPGFENLRIGASFQPSFARMVFETYAEAAMGTEVEAHLEVVDPFIPAGQIGAMLRLWRFDIGLQLRLSADIEADGNRDPDESGDIELRAFDATTGAESTATAESVTFIAPYPRAVLRFGFRYFQPRENIRPDARMPWQRELFDVELDVIYENQSQNEGYDVTMRDVNINDTIRLEELNFFVRHNWQDTVSIRLGGSVHLFDGMMTISAGASWESPTTPNEFTRLDFTSWMRVGLALGVTLRISIIELTVAYQHIFSPDRDVDLPEGYDPSDPDASGDEICDVAACQLSADPTEADRLSSVIVNAGHYELSYDILSISLGFRWGQGSGWLRDRELAGDPAGGADMSEPELDEEAGEDVEMAPETGAVDDEAAPAEEPTGGAADESMLRSEPAPALAAEAPAEDGFVGGQTAPPSEPDEEPTSD